MLLKYPVLPHPRGSLTVGSRASNPQIEIVVSLKQEWVAADVYRCEKWNRCSERPARFRIPFTHQKRGQPELRDRENLQGDSNGDVASRNHFQDHSR